MENSFLFDHPGLETGYYPIQLQTHTNTIYYCCSNCQHRHQQQSTINNQPTTLELLHCVQRAIHNLLLHRMFFFESSPTVCRESE